MHAGGGALNAIRALNPAGEAGTDAPAHLPLVNLLAEAREAAEVDKNTPERLISAIESLDERLSEQQVQLRACDELMKEQALQLSEKDALIELLREQISQLAPSKPRKCVAGDLEAGAEG